MTADYTHMLCLARFTESAAAERSPVIFSALRHIVEDGE